MKFKIKFENIFVVLSILFLFGCCCFYGYRLVKYYKIFNPKNEEGKKTEVLSATIRKDNPVVSEGDGLYILNGDFVFKGNTVNNYVSYNDKVWRIIRVNRNGSVKLASEDALTEMAFDSNNNSYDKSEIYSYVKENINVKETALEKMLTCLDDIDDVTKITCTKTTDEYISVLSVSDYANSINSTSGKSFINNTKNIWLSSKTSDDSVWNVANGILKVADASNKYSVKATILLKGTAYSASGDGTEKDPYVVKGGE